VINVAYPKFDFKIKEENNKEFIYDELRRKWLVLTPEEWVRQNFVRYLVDVKKYPASLIAIEKEVKVGELKKRFDIVVYKNDVPWMIVECKQMNIKMDENVLQQVLSYQSQLQASFLVVTNGNTTHLLEKKINHFIEVDEFVEW